MNEREGMLMAERCYLAALAGDNRNDACVIRSRYEREPEFQGTCSHIEAAVYPVFFWRNKVFRFHRHEIIQHCFSFTGCEGTCQYVGIVNI